MPLPKPRILSRLEALFEAIIFSSRWIQAPIYAALIVAAGAYAWKSIEELVHILAEFRSLNEVKIMLGLLSLVDISMVANLVNMVVVGGYVTFVSNIDFADNKDRPDWLDHINANTLKTKLAGSLASISAIHLLKSFINLTDGAKVLADNDVRIVLWQSIIHGVFLASMMLFAWSERIQRHDEH